jgi:hypothetical protein
MLFALELLFAFLLPLVAALKFDIQAHPGHESASKERCIRRGNSDCERNQRRWSDIEHARKLLAWVLC